jgi:hypothetical protein
MRKKGCRVLYFAGYKARQDRYKVEEIEKAADSIVWCCDESPGFAPSRSCDQSFVGNMCDALEAYARGDIPNTLPLKDIHRLLVIGSDGLMAAVTRARQTILRHYLNPRHIAIGSINSPMQCMMKEICGQCLQRHRDPKTGEEKIVYSCAEQDQCLDHVDFGVLKKRLSQNSLQEKVTDAWLRSSLG